MGVFLCINFSVYSRVGFLKLPQAAGSAVATVKPTQVEDYAMFQ